MATEELDTIIKDMLGALATFQARTKELDPLKAKQKQRFVIGLKQVSINSESDIQSDSPII